MPHATPDGGLQRHFGLLQATALNVTMIVGAGVFVTIPLMLLSCPARTRCSAGSAPAPDPGGRPGLERAWRRAARLGRLVPVSAGELRPRRRWGRLMAFLFIWQFLLSGPLEIASGLIAMAQFSPQLSSGLVRASSTAAHLDVASTLSASAGQPRQSALRTDLGPARLIWPCGWGC